MDISELEYTQTNDNLHIVDSYKVSKRDFSYVILKISGEYAKDNFNFPLWYINRSFRSLKCEWAVHNFLYKLGMFKDHTKDVDLNYPCDRPQWLYTLLGIFVWIFIK